MPHLLKGNLSDTSRTPMSLRVSLKHFVLRFLFVVVVVVFCFVLLLFLIFTTPCPLASELSLVEIGPEDNFERRKNSHKITLHEIAFLL